ncbi:MAG: ISKra4 family transposase [Rhodopila sp.]
MGWVVRLVRMGAGEPDHAVDVLELPPRRNLSDIDDLGLTLAEAKQILTAIQRTLVATQADDHAAQRPVCSRCGGTCNVKDWQDRQIATLFGVIAVSVPRFRCSACRHGETGLHWPSHCRSTPAFDRLRAHLSALMPYRVAAGVLDHLLPVGAGIHHETLRGHTFRAGEQLRHEPPRATGEAASAMTVSLDSTFIRGCRADERQLEVRIGNVEVVGGHRRVFGAVVDGGTDIAALIRQQVLAAGRTEGTDVACFTDGCPALRSILAKASLPKRPIADWFHIAMRLQHARQAASGLTADKPSRTRAKTAIVTEVERLRWRLWNGKAKDATVTLDRIRPLMRAYRGEQSTRHGGVSSRKLWTAVREVHDYVRGQAARLVNYAARHRAGHRVGTSLTEGTANFLVNRRMNKSQQMRWTRRGADLLLQVRCAVYNGVWDDGIGSILGPETATIPLVAATA